MRLDGTWEPEEHIPWRTRKQYQERQDDRGRLICETKVRLTEDEAEASCKNLWEMKRIRRYKYQCWYCHQWHTSSNPPRVAVVEEGEALETVDRRGTDVDHQDRPAASGDGKEP